MNENLKRKMDLCAALYDETRRAWGVKAGKLLADIDSIAFSISWKAETAAGYYYYLGQIGQRDKAI